MRKMWTQGVVNVPTGEIGNDKLSVTRVSGHSGLPVFGQSSFGHLRAHLEIYTTSPQRKHAYIYMYFLTSPFSNEIHYIKTVVNRYFSTIIPGEKTSTIRDE